MTDHDLPAGPDPRLGQALRGALDPGDHTAFMAQLLDRLPRRGTWELLAEWTRPGLVAALLLLAALGFWTGTARPTATAPDPVAAISSGDRPLDREALDIAILGPGR